MFIAMYKRRSIVVDDIHGKYDDDIQFNAYYEDSEEEVPDEALDYIRDCYFDKLYEEWFDNKVGEADMLMDAMKDRNL